MADSREQFTDAENAYFDRMDAEYAERGADDQITARPAGNPRFGAAWVQEMADWSWRKEIGPLGDVDGLLPGQDQCDELDWTYTFAFQWEHEHTSEYNPGYVFH